MEIHFDISDKKRNTGKQKKTFERLPTHGKVQFSQRCCRKIFFAIRSVLAITMYIIQKERKSNLENLSERQNKCLSKTEVNDNIFWQCKYVPIACEWTKSILLKEEFVISELRVSSFLLNGIIINFRQSCTEVRLW